MAQINRSFVVLDGLRGICALAIVTLHAPLFFQSFFNSLPDASEGQAGYFYLAVDFLFALSGFVVAHAYGKRLTEGMSVKHFMAVRLIRFYPLYVLSIVIAVGPWLGVFVFDQISRKNFLIDLVAGLLFLPSPESGYLFPFNVVAWSLFLQLITNTLLALLWRRLTTTLLAAIVIATGLLLAAAILTGNFGAGTSAVDVAQGGFAWATAGDGVLRIGFAFFEGVLVYRLWSMHRPTWQVPAIVIVAATAAILVAYAPREFATAFDLLATFAAFPLLIWLGASSVATGFWGRLFKWFGTISYAFYILQVPVGNLIVDVLQAVLHDNRLGDTEFFPWPYAIVFVAFLLALSTFADLYFDRPIRKRLSAALAKLRERRAATRASAGLVLDADG